MKKLSLLLFTGLTITTLAQEIDQPLKRFNRIIASPKINVVLEKGEQEHIRLVYSNVAADQINIEVHNKTLHLFLDDARIVRKNQCRHKEHNYNMYYDVSVTAYVTYNSLKYLEIRGEQELTCNSELDANVFTLKAYGENEITIANLNTGFLRASLYGENKLRIKDGKAYEQRYRLFGENKINTQNLKSYNTLMNIYGEGRSHINATDHLRITAFGAPEVRVVGGAQIKRIAFGAARISRD